MYAGAHCDTCCVHSESDFALQWTAKDVMTPQKKAQYSSSAIGKIIFGNDDLVDIDLLYMRGDERS